MPDVYIAPGGSDTATGTLADPWLTLGRAVLASGLIGLTEAISAYIQPGTYQATNVALTKPISLIGLGSGVVVEPASRPGQWSTVTAGGQLVWHASLPIGQRTRITQATWQDADGYHRIPVWNPAPPLDTADKWAVAVLGPANVHTRWGLYSTATGLYLIPPAEWTDPNTVKILTGWAPAFVINGPDITIVGLELPGHGTGIRFNPAAARVHIANVTTDCCRFGIGIYAAPSATYGHDHLIERCTFRDNGVSIREGDPEPLPGQGIPWNLVKQNGVNLGSILVNKPLTESESGGIFNNGGALNVKIQVCTFDGSFDGIGNWEDGRFDAQANAGLSVAHCLFRNLADDALDISRNEGGMTVTDCTFRNVGTILSPAPLWGKVTLRDCEGSMIGDQVRVKDGHGNRPPGSIVKCGGIDPAHTQGTVRIENSTFWTDNPTTQGISQDGGVGMRGPRLEIVDSTIRAGFIAVNWPYPAADFLDQGNTWATSSTRPLKTALPIKLTPVAEVDARYYDPKDGDFSPVSAVTDLQVQLASLNQQLADMRAAKQRLQAAVQQAMNLLANVLAQP